MQKIVINGKEITTNLGGNYYIGNGNATTTMNVFTKRDIYESDEEFVERLAGMGYTHITLKYSTTCIKGYYHTYALAK